MKTMAQDLETVQSTKGSFSELQKQLEESTGKS